MKEESPRIYAGECQEKEAQQIHAVIQQYKQSPGKELLDVACGTGAHIAFLRRDYMVEGLDLDEEK
jgi:cyclopropane fatty-acyl-phospholipid synthase-like methyltransferase